MKPYQSKEIEEISLAEYENILNIIYVLDKLKIKASPTASRNFFNKFMKSQIIDMLDNMSGGDTTSIV
jgi:ferritin